MGGGEGDCFGDGVKRENRSIEGEGKGEASCLLSLLVSALLLHPFSSAATHPVVVVPVLKDSTAVHEIEYGLHWS